MPPEAARDCRHPVVSRQSGRQLKEVAQLHGWLRDRSTADVEALCVWG